MLQLWPAVALFSAATVAVLVIAPRIAGVSDRLATRTGLGSALFGAIFLGASTSLPGLVLTATAALRGQPQLAAASAIGGVAAQTMFLGIVDVAYGRGSLQRRAVSRKVLAQAALLFGLLSLVVVAVGVPDLMLGPVHPVTPLLVVGYLAVLPTVRSQPGHREHEGDVQQSPSEVARREQGSSPESGDDAPLRLLWLRYASYAALLALAGYTLARAVQPIAGALGLSLTAAGALLAGVATSTPELLTAVSAARRGNLGLAVGDILGGNCFDMLFLGVADGVIAGSLYAQLGSEASVLAGLALLLNAVLLLGFVRRSRQRLGRASPESVVAVAVYAAVAAVLLAR